MYRCAHCRRSVYAADVNTEFRGPARLPSKIPAKTA